MENYEQMIEKAYANIKTITSNEERFETPKIEGHIEGTKTILTNIPQITTYIRRDPNHFFKFLLKELATSGSLKNNVALLHRTITSQKINDKIIDYVKEFVLCKQCQKPDTELIKDKDFLFMHCLACGAKHSIRAKI